MTNIAIMNFQFFVILFFKNPIINVGVIEMVITDRKTREIVKQNGRVRKKGRHIVNAFLIGGSLGMIGQGFYELLLYYSTLSEKNATVLISAGVIFITFLLTCFGVYDRYAKIAGAGSFIPISGFANSITSSALEGRTEGLIFGIGGKIFSLIGCVCAYGVVSSILLGFLYFLYRVIFYA